MELVISPRLVDALSACFAHNSLLKAGRTKVVSTAHTSHENGKIQTTVNAHRGQPTQRKRVERFVCLFVSHPFSVGDGG